MDRQELLDLLDKSLDEELDKRVTERVEEDFLAALAGIGLDDDYNAKVNDLCDKLAVATKGIGNLSMLVIYLLKPLIDRGEIRATWSPDDDDESRSISVMTEHETLSINMDAGLFILNCEGAKPQ